MPESASPEPIEKPAGCLTTLGSVRLTLESPDREPLVIIGPGKPLALLTYLALSVGRTATRDHLTTTLRACSSATTAGFRSTGPSSALASERIRSPALLATWDSRSTSSARLRVTMRR